MAIDLSSIFGGAQGSQASGMQDALSAGANGVLGFLEGTAISALQADQKTTTTAAQNSVNNILNSPSSPLGSYFSNLVQSPVLKNYGPYISGGVVVVGIIGYMLARK